MDYSKEFRDLITCTKDTEDFIGEEFYLRRTKALPRGFIKKKGDFTAANSPINSFRHCESNTLFCILQTFH